MFPKLEPPSSDHLLSIHNTSCLLKKKQQKTKKRTHTRTQRTAVALSAACTLGVYLHSLLRALLCGFSTSSCKGLPFIPRHAGTLCLVGTLPLHGMSSPTHSKRSSSNVTSSVEPAPQFSPGPFPVPAKTNCPFPYMYVNGIRLVLLLRNLEFIRGKARVHQ